MIDNPVMSFEASPISLTRSVSFLVQYRHVASVVKVGGGGQTQPKNLNKETKYGVPRNLQNPNPWEGGGDEKAAR